MNRSPTLSIQELPALRHTNDNPAPSSPTRSSSNFPGIDSKPSIPFRRPSSTIDEVYYSSSLHFLLYHSSHPPSPRVTQTPRNSSSRTDITSHPLHPSLSDLPTLPGPARLPPETKKDDPVRYWRKRTFTLTSTISTYL